MKAIVGIIMGSDSDAQVMQEAAKVLRVAPATVRSLASHARATMKLSMETDNDA